MIWLLKIFTFIIFGFGLYLTIVNDLFWITALIIEAIYVMIVIIVPSD